MDNQIQNQQPAQMNSSSMSQPQNPSEAESQRINNDLQAALELARKRKQADMSAITKENLDAILELTDQYRGISNEKLKQFKREIKTKRQKVLEVFLAFFGTLGLGCVMAVFFAIWVWVFFYINSLIY